MRPLLIIAGATGTGKTDIAIECAKKMDGEIISCDSMQIYKGLDIGTAKISRSEMQGIPHHMIDIVSPDSSFTVHDFQEIATEKIDEIFAKAKLPILCGGTGLYINSILYEMSFSGELDHELRRSLLEEAERIGKEAMHRKLCALDPQAAERLHPNDIKRVIRAIEKAMTGGVKENDFTKQRYPYKMYLTDLSREEMYRRINLRVDKMIAMGLKKEVFDLLKRGIGYDKQSMQAIAYKEWALTEDPAFTDTDVIDLIKKNTRNYAKRQITWFKQYHDANRIPVENRTAEEIALEIAEDYNQ